MEINPTHQSQIDGPIGSDIDNLDGSIKNPRISSAQRMKYAAEVQLVKKRWGDLESIRKNLGLSQRKICQLLFVDPSAWTRWTRNEGEAPPHIYRALSWFLLLQEKHPETAPYQWLQAVARPQMPEIEIQKIKARLEDELRDGIISNMKPKLSTRTKVLLGLILFNVLLFCLIMLFQVRAHAQEESIPQTTAEQAIPSDVNSKLVADSFGSASIGHNLSTNNNVLKKNQWSLGTLYVGYGIDDNFTLATSVWVLGAFDMFNVMGRYVWRLSSRESLGIDVAYFKSFGGQEFSNDYCYAADESGNPVDCRSQKFYSGFVMEAAAAKLTYGLQMTDYYRFNTTLSSFYYWDDRMPFSFRMDPANNDPYTLNLTTLNEFKVNRSFFVNLEAGVWGLNYEYLYYHTGLTFNIQNESGVIGIGASTTFSPTFPKEQAKTFVSYDSRRSIHPEIQVQLFF